MKKNIYSSNKYNPNNTTLNNTIYQNALEDEDPFTEQSLLMKLDEKFGNVELWIKGKSKDLKKEIFDLVDGIEISSNKQKPSKPKKK